jgi:hypothetical protein
VGRGGRRKAVAGGEGHASLARFFAESPRPTEELRAVEDLQEASLGLAAHTTAPDPALALLADIGARALAELAQGIETRKLEVPRHGLWRESINTLSSEDGPPRVTIFRRLPLVDAPLLPSDFHIRVFAVELLVNIDVPPNLVGRRTAALLALLAVGRADDQFGLGSGGVRYPWNASALRTPILAALGEEPNDVKVEVQELLAGEPASHRVLSERADELTSANTKIKAGTPSVVRERDPDAREKAMVDLFKRDPDLLGQADSKLLAALEDMGAKMKRSTLREALDRIRGRDSSDEGRRVIELHDRTRAGKLPRTPVGQRSRRVRERELETLSSIEGLVDSDE